VNDPTTWAGEKIPKEMVAKAFADMVGKRHYAFGIISP